MYDYYFNFTKAKNSARIDTKSSYFEMRAEYSKYESIIRELAPHSSIHEFVHEIGPYLFKAIQPSLRFASTHLFNESEHIEMRRVIELMKHFKFKLNP